MAFILVCVLTLHATASAQTPAAWIGTWKQNFEKSTSGSARYKRVTTRIEALEDRLKVTYDMIGARGGVTHMEWTGKFDGKDYPVQGVDYVLTNAYRLINDRSYEIEIKVDGRAVANVVVTVSEDGKTLTTVTTESQTVTSKAVYDRQ